MTPILPLPRQSNLLEQRTASPSRLHLRSEIELDPHLSFPWSGLRERWRTAGTEVLSTPQDPADSSSRQLVIQLSATLPEQGYELEFSPGKVLLVGADLAGLRYGLLTLEDLTTGPSTAPGWPLGIVRDWPQFRHRGVMLDVSRCKVPTLETLRWLVTCLARLKLNELQLYVEHSFAFPGHEVVWGMASPLTGPEVVELDLWCQLHGIELVPNLNSLGHYERWLRHPEYRHLAECPNGFTLPWGQPSDHGTTLCPTDDATFEFLGSLYDAYLPSFSSGRFNVGGDEPWELGQGRSKPEAEARGRHRVYLDALLRIHRLVGARGRSMQFWADIVLERPELVAELPSDLTGMVWGYDSGHPYPAQCQRFAETKVPFYVCPGTSSWNTLGGRLANALANLQEAALAGRDHGAVGFLNTDWGDGGHHQVLPVSFPGFLAGAARSWHPEADLSRTLLAEGLSRYFLDPEGVNPHAGHALAEALLDLGSVRSLLSKQLGNQHPLNSVLFSSWKNLDKALQGIPLEELLRCQEALGLVVHTVQAVSCSAPAPNSLSREISLAARLLQHAVNRGLDHLRAGHPDNRARRRELIPLIGEYEDLWLRRNRPGGLMESSQRLRAILEDYR